MWYCDCVKTHTKCQWSFHMISAKCSQILKTCFTPSSLCTVSSHPLRKSCSVKSSQTSPGKCWTTVGGGVMPATFLQALVRCILWHPSIKNPTIHLLLFKDTPLIRQCCIRQCWLISIGLRPTVPSLTCVSNVYFSHKAPHMLFLPGHNTKHFGTMLEGHVK